jgi:predicted nucleic acid-binding protein
MPIKLLPDTCVWIDFLKNRNTTFTLQLEQALLQGEVYTCGVVLYELLQGIRNPGDDEQVQAAFDALVMFEVTAQTWVSAAKLTSELKKQGITLPMSDIIIAAVALEHNLTIMTVDQHFQQIAGLLLLTE